MCGIAGVIHRGAAAPIGAELTKMLQSLKHRGPDSTGYAVYGSPPQETSYVIRFNTIEPEMIGKGSSRTRELMEERKEEFDRRLLSMGGAITESDSPRDYSSRYVVNYDGDLRELAEYLEEIDGVEILSIGRSLELVKDLGDAEEVSANYGLNSYVGTHAIGHVRMATESDVDIRSAHPFWAYPFSDVSVVHNGQLTNYWKMRRALERKGHRFMSDCDSEVIAVFLADRMHDGVTLEDAMRESVQEMDGVFTYLVATRDELGMAKDTMAAKPMVLYESPELIVLASEEVAIRSIFPEEIDTSDPYEGEVMVWRT
jgi:glutamate synthase domain-containing protein 1